MAKIKVHEKALAHLSRGLYRSPASALRELVSNAWDANATLIRIDMNYPNFFQVSVEDNGDGFSKEEFRTLMGGGIGNSLKRPYTEPVSYGRPLIGRLGIGMLGISQICGSFTISSKLNEGGEGFRASVHLYDLLKERLDAGNSGIVKTSTVDVGEYNFEDFDPITRNTGVTIITNDVHPTFVHSFQKSLEFEKYREPSLQWRDNLKIMSSLRSLQELGDYWRLIWELSTACPIPYLDEQALPENLIKEDQERLKGYKFKVILDNIELRKPVYLRGNPDGYTIKKIERRAEKVYGKDLKYQGYIIVQEGRQLRPDELRGILIRIKNVGIGYYDPSMLDYRINEGPRSRWVTGEIFIDEGLEDALNIDRDSFNKFHPEYRAIQSFVHAVLQKEVFPKVYKQIDIRSNTKAKIKAEKHSEHLAKVISKAVESPVIVKSRSTVGKVEPYKAPRVSVTKKAKKVEVELPPAETVRTKKPYRELVTAILAVYEIAIRERTEVEKKEKFTELVIDLLSKW